jgi:hypothetical protein
VQRFGLLVMGSTAFALAADLILAPALLRFFYKAVPQTVSVIPHDSSEHGELFDSSSRLIETN